MSDTISPRTPVKPSVPAATAAAAMVLTLLGASGQSSATDPLNKTRRPSSSVQSESTSPVSRKQDGCLDILINKLWRQEPIRRTSFFSMSSPGFDLKPCCCYLQASAVIQPLDVLPSPQRPARDVQRPTRVLSCPTQLLVQVTVSEGRGRAHLGEAHNHFVTSSPLTQTTILYAYVKKRTTRAISCII